MDLSTIQSSFGVSKVFNLLDVRIFPTSVIEHGIYAIYRQSDEKIYIGKCQDKHGIRKRWRRHVTDLIYGRHPNKYLQNSYNKSQDKDDFKFFVLERLEESFHVREAFWVNLFQSMNPKHGWNLEGIDVFGRKTISSEIKDKISRTMLARQPNLGKKHSKESKALMSAMAKGRKASDATRMKLSMARIGVKQSSECISKRVEKTCKTYSLVSPLGKIVSITNLAKFARENELSATALLKVFKGKYKSSHGWTKPLTSARTLSAEELSK